MKYILIIVQGMVKKYVGPFNSEESALQWANVNVDGRIYPYKVETLDSPGDSPGEVDKVCCCGKTSEGSGLCARCGQTP